MKLKDEILNILVLMFSVAVLIFVLSCDDFKSEEFQISDKDAVACEQLSDTVFSSLVLQALTDFDTTWVDSNVIGNASEILDALVANDIVLQADGSEATRIVTTAADSNYFVMRSDFGSIICYADESITIELISDDNQVQRASDTTMPLETVSGCTVLEKDKPVALIRSRMKYGFSQDRYLVLFIKNDQTRSGNIKLSILSN